MGPTEFSVSIHKVTIHSGTRWLGRLGCNVEFSQEHQDKQYYMMLRDWAYSYVGYLPGGFYPKDDSGSVRIPHWWSHV